MGRKATQRDKEYSREWKQRNRSRVRAQHRELYENRRRQGTCVKCGLTPSAENKTRCQACEIRNREIKKKYAEKLRREVFAAYGGFRCHCCGETEPKFLCIDHINGGGTRHVREICPGQFYMWLRHNKFPGGFQVLCHNCNIGRHLNGGTCPHSMK